MKKKSFSTITDIKHNRAIFPETDTLFLFLLQRGLLLALKEDGFLTQMQYRYAEEKLKQQRCDPTWKER